MSQPQPTARRQLDFLKRQAWVIILVTVVAVVVAAAASFSQPKVYRAHTSIVIGQAGGIFQPQFGNVFQPFTQTMSSLLKSEIVAETVIRDLNLDETPKSLLSDVEVASTPNSAVLQVTVDSKDRAYAVRVLRRMASVFTSLVQEKLGGTPKTPGAAGALPPITATVFDPAHASSTPVSPRPTRTIAFAGVIGLALGLVLALLREALDDRLRGRAEVEEHFGAPVVAALPRSMLGRSAVGPTREIVPSFLRAVEPLRLQLSGNGSRGTLVVITSGSSGEGKSTVAASLSVALSLAGQDVICVDADPTPPRLTKYLELQQADGNASGPQVRSDLAASLRDVELQRSSPRVSGEEKTAAQPLGGAAGGSRTSDLDSAGDGNGRPGRIQLLVWGDNQEELLAIDDLTAELKARAAYVVVDTPPLPSSTTLSLLSIADETVVITREKKTKKAQATFVRQTLERLQVRNYSIVSFG